ncbi:zinc finger BED domain-containing protein RICESLEEPER 2-like [Papaver somniferum]|uniref:zinc finger BED domain-containing protein RICESLEEPER 2-like n=1 Tax=Papaver somniferum TaxID=3469 RepID=UPI000E704089|nr:zinc finger BED domain-containing protein RICESLEEPER 2-like [Papaver somniferum]
MSSVQEQDHYNDVMSSDGEDDDDVEMLDSVNEDATVGCAPALVSLGKKHKLRSQVWEFFKLVKYKDGTKKGVCKACNAGYKYESQKGGTPAMKRHKCPNRRICLTSDMWTSVTTTGYISLTAHYLDQDWVLQKKLLNLCPLPPPHTGEHLSAKLFAMIEDCGIEDKSRLVAKKILLNDGKLFHVRCCAHILALIVKEGLKKIDPAVLKIRLSVKSLKKSQVRKQKFLDIVDTLGMSGMKRGIRQDVKTRWNSTYLMLDSCILYKPVFSHLKLVDSDYEDCPTDEEWEQIEVVTKFLKVFHDLTKIFFGSKYPTSNLYFERICQVQVLLKKESRNDIEFIRNMVKEMQAKFDSYWKELSPILVMAVVLDPRSKMNFVKFTYSKLYPEVRELEREVNKVRSNMKTLFNEYYTLSSSTASNSCATQNLGIQNGGNSAAEEGSDFFQEYVATQERGGDVLTDLSELDEYLGESYRGKEDMDENNGIIEEDVLGFEPDAVEDGGSGGCGGRSG